MDVYASNRQTERITSFAVALAVVSLFGLTFVPHAALAQDKPVPAPPPGFEPAPLPPLQGAQQAPPGYGAPGYPPPGYPPPGYGYVPPSPTLPYEEGDPIPPGYRLDSRPRRGLVVGGISMLASAWGLSLIIGLSVDTLAAAFGDNKSVAWPLYIPVVGPFVGIGVFDSKAAGTFVLAVDGLVQAGGLAMIIAGFAAPEKRLVRGADPQAQSGFVTVLPMPFGKNGVGLGLVGTM